MKPIDIIKRERDEALAKLAAAEAACAKKDGALRMAKALISDGLAQAAIAHNAGGEVVTTTQWLLSKDTRKAIDEALSSTCGQGWNSPVSAPPWARRRGNEAFL